MFIVDFEDVIDLLKVKVFNSCCNKKVNIVYSKNNVSIRLTKERWFHIVENHDELAGRVEDILETIAEPDIIAKGIKQGLLAAKRFDGKYTVVVYKETSKKDGFIITAFETNRIQYLLKKEVVWTKQ